MGSTSLVSQAVAMAALWPSQRQDVLLHMRWSPEAKEHDVSGKEGMHLTVGSTNWKDPRAFWCGCTDTYKYL